MSGSCCEGSSAALAALRVRQGRVLWLVLVLNAAMFLVEFVAGWFARSTALLGDSLDMLGDAFVYAFSLWVLHRGDAWRARAAFSKGLVQLGFGLVVLVEAGFKLRAGITPDAETMAGIGLLALAVNSWCFYVLWRHRSDDVNMRSTWLCSRNDLIANAAVLVAAGLVAWLASPWPDVLVGLGIAALFLRTAVGVISESRAALAQALESES
jgi:cation diffusion facilitator family transporter